MSNYSNYNNPREVKAKVLAIEAVSPSPLNSGPSPVLMRLAIDSGNSISFAPGQFAHVAVPGMTLRRPFSIASLEDNVLELIFNIVGEGTRQLSILPAGVELSVLLPLGQGWPMDKVMNILEGGGKIWLVAGGIGVVPLLSCAKQIAVATKSKSQNFDVTSFIGFRDTTQAFDSRYLNSLTEIGPATIQVDGLITEPLIALLNEKTSNKPDLLLACGPKLFLKAVQDICLKHDIRAFASFEEAMGCGIGACLTCSCGVKVHDAANTQDKNHYIRVCRDGPVLDLAEVVFNEQA